MSTFEEQTLKLLRLCNQVMSEVQQLLHCSIEIVNDVSANQTSNGENLRRKDVLVEECDRNRKIAIKVRSIYETVKNAYLTVTTLSNVDSELIEGIRKTFENYCETLKRIHQSIEVKKNTLAQMSAV